MRISGIDFTSAPRKSKAITCADCILAGSILTVEKLDSWTDFKGFESYLNGSGTCLTAIDAPLGQPLRLIQALGWPAHWEQYVQLIGASSKRAFVKILTDYCQAQPAGDKHHLRRTDALAGACSPMMMYGVPVGKMFYEAAPRIANSTVNVLPCRPTNSSHRVVEAYPALVARRLTGNKSYKGHDQRKEMARSRQRAMIVEQCQSSALTKALAVRVSMPQDLAWRLKEDQSGDSLDAVLCAIQAAAAVQKGTQLGIPRDADPREGWIIGC
jgi:hypothetical protein